MKKIFSMVAMAALAWGLTSCDGTPEDITKATVCMYNIVVDESDFAAPATITQDWSNFVIDFARGKFRGDIKAHGQGVNVSFATGDMDMTIGKRSFEFSKGAIMTAGQDVTNLKGMYDNRTGALTIDYKVNGNYHVYCCESFAYNFCTTNRTVGDDHITIKGVRFELMPNLDKNTFTVLVYNFRKSPNHYPVNLIFENIPFTIAHSGYLEGISDKCANTKDIQGDNSDYTATILKAWAYPVDGTGSLQFDMDGVTYKIEGNVFSPVTDEK